MGLATSFFGMTVGLQNRVVDLGAGGNVLKIHFHYIVQSRGRILVGSHEEELGENRNSDCSSEVT